MSISLTLKKPAKKAVQLLEKILPKKVFSVFLKILFPVYRFSIRNLYMLKGILFYALFNKEKWMMTKEIYRILPYTMVGLGGLEATYKLCKSTLENKVEGDFVELGVARGGCAAMIGNVLFGDKKHGKDRKLLLFDSYEGLPPPTKEDYAADAGSTTGDHVQPLVQGSCLGTLDEVKNLLLNINKLPDKSIKFIQGWFQESVPAYAGKIDKIALLRMDGDWYESTKACMEGLYDSVSEGGAVIIDDYHSCFGCKRAIDEYLQKNNIEVELSADGRGGSYFIKPARKNKSNAGENTMAELEERKLKEIEHSKLRRGILQGYERIADTHVAQQAVGLESLIKDKEAFRHYFANMKYYSVALSSDTYLDRKSVV